MGILSELPLPTFIDLVLSPVILKALAAANSYVALIGLLALTLVAVFGQFKKRQKIVSGISIVGGNDREAVLRNRTRSIHDGKAMLLEGYQKVTNHS